jgi:hypothetical protein
MVDIIISIFILSILTPIFIYFLYIFKDLFKKPIKNDENTDIIDKKYNNKPIFRGNKPIIRYKNDDTKI